MPNELPKTYDPHAMEERLYKKWEEGGFFSAEPDPARTPFTIMMPPPNITGQLHLGHALDTTIQDILIRMKRMQGYCVLWQPGTDHASIATELKIVETLAAEGLTKEDLGREAYLERAWAWQAEYGGRIVGQLRKLGASCDWTRERFTMDEGLSRAVIDVFCDMYEQGHIYRGSRLINWCPVCRTTISDAEVEHEEKNSHLWYFKYPLVEDGSISDKIFLTVATTRPETILGDTAVAVHPDDERYRHLVGRKVHIALMDRNVPVVADSYVDKDFGSGVVKITPAHDPNDYELAKRHNLPEINVLNDDASINENGGPLSGLSREAARAAVVKDFEERGLLVKIEPYSHNVGTHDRCHQIIEPMIKPQWLVRMDELIKPAAQAVRNGEIRLVPKRAENTYFAWVDNIRDWCVSRQLWWGHRIPAYTCLDCGSVYVAPTAVKVCPDCASSQMEQDPDTLDTWFSSALWPFSTLGWPEETADFKYFYPTNVLVTGYDIIFLWVARMIFSSYAHVGVKPFDTVLVHGLIRDAEGKKMSKSSGNGIDPLDIIEQYGADALRFSLIIGSATGADMRIHIEKIEAARNFANKIWNSARFIMMKADNAGEGEGELTDSVGQRSEPAAILDPETLSIPDKWILHSLGELIRTVSGQMDEYELGLAAQGIHGFIWDEFCDWYIEMVKPSLTNSARATLIYTLGNALKLLHPFMPFITEEIYAALLQTDASIMLSKWPVANADLSFPAAKRQVELLKEAVRAVRNIRAEMNVSPGKTVDIYLRIRQTEEGEALVALKDYFCFLAKAGRIIYLNADVSAPEGAVSAMTSSAAIYIPLNDLVNITQEQERLTKEAARLDGEIERSRNILKNPRFLEKAPAGKIAEEEKKQEKYQQMREQVKIRLQQFAELDKMIPGS